MAKFLTGNELNSELGKLFEAASEKLILISPYIKLHVHFESILRTKHDNHKLKIVLVFGKNESDVSRSMSIEDLNFFKEFPNIEIRYEKRLHAKYYANETSAIQTSMNLYSYSQDNNIEAGVLTTETVLGSIANNLVTNVTGENSFDIQASSYFNRVIEQSELVYKKSPHYESLLLGLSKKYNGSKVEYDKLIEFFEEHSKHGFQEKKETYSKIEIANKHQEEKPNGYCIRTGKKIPFNFEKPFSYEAFKSWNEYKNENFREKYCHFSGEFSNGETSKKNPILIKNLSNAKEIFRF